MILVGIDEAGRGAEVGPLVVAAVAIDSQRLGELTQLGLRDSKMLTAARRQAVAQQIRQAAIWTGEEFADAALVDAYVRRGRRSLNSLERVLARRLLAKAPPAGRVVADGERLFAALARRHQVLACDHADIIFGEVTAAGLLAKVRRDELLSAIDDRLASLIGRIPRGGYPGRETSAWIEKYQRFFGSPPPEVRSSWYGGRKPAARVSSAPSAPAIVQGPA